MNARIPTRISSSVAACLLACLSAHAQISYNGGNYSQDFNTLPFDMTTAQSLTGAGPFDVPTQSGGNAEGWSIFKNGGSGTIPRIQSNDGSTNSGSIYFY